MYKKKLEVQVFTLKDFILYEVEIRTILMELNETEDCILDYKYYNKYSNNTKLSTDIIDKRKSLKPTKDGINKKTLKTFEDLIFVLYGEEGKIFFNNTKKRKHSVPVKSNKCKNNNSKLNKK